MVRGGRNHRSAVCAASRESRCSDTSLSCRNLRARSSVDGERNKCLRLRSVGWSSHSVAPWPSARRGVRLQDLRPKGWALESSELGALPPLHSSQSSADAVLQHAPQGCSRARDAFAQCWSATATSTPRDSVPPWLQDRIATNTLC